MPDEPKEPIESADGALQSKKRHRFKVIFFSLVLVFILLLSVLNGPVARFVIKDQINRAATQQGLSGDLVIEGTLWEGFTLSNIDYSGESGVQVLKVGKAVVGYDPLRLIHKEVELLSLEGVEVVIDVDKFPEKEGAQESGDGLGSLDLIELSQTLRGYVTPVEISLIDVDVEVVQSGELMAAVAWEGFRHDSGADVYQLTGFQAKNADLINTLPQDVTLVWQDGSLELDCWEVLPRFAIEEVNIMWSEEVRGHGAITLGEARFTAALSESLSLELNSGVLTTDLIEQALKIDLPLDASLDQVVLRVGDWSEPIGQWEASGDLHLISANYDQYNLSDASLSVLQEEGEYFLKLDTVLNEAPVALTVDGVWAEPGKKKWWENTSLDYTLKIPKLGQLPQLWLKKEIEVDYENVAVELSGDAVVNNRELAEVSAQGTLSQLSVNGEGFAPLKLKVNLASDLIQGEVSLEGASGPELAVKGQYSLQDQSYQGDAVVAAQEAGWANALLQFSGQEIELIDQISLNWKGSSNGETHQGDLSVESLITDFPRLSTIVLNDTKVNYNYSGEVIAGKVVKGGDEVVADGFYSLSDQSYGGSLSVNAQDPGFLNSVLKFTKKEIVLEDAVVLSWTGKGGAERHEGDLKVVKLTANYEDTPKINLKVGVKYDYPEFVNVEEFSLQEGEWKADSSLAWDGRFIDLQALEVYRSKDQVAKLSGRVPYQLEVRSKENFFSQDAPWNLDISTSSLSFGKVKEWTGLEIPEQISGMLESELKVGGRPSAPTLEGHTYLLNVLGIGLEKPLELKTTFSSVGDKLRMKAAAVEGRKNRVVAEGEIPFSPLEWIREPETVVEKLKNAPIDADGQLFAFPLNQLSTYIPELEDIDGNVSVKGEFKGSVNNPKYTLDVKGEVPSLNLVESSFGTMKNISVEVKISEDRLAKVDSVATLSGSKVQVTGETDMTDFTAPIFNLTLSGNNILVHRDDLVSMRATAQVTLKGALDDASLTGRVSAVESIVYKDIELIPIGVPSSSVANVALPSIGGGDDNGELPVPDLIADWKLDLTIDTKDPILIRGNLARGRVEGEIQVGGTLRNPEPTGKMYVRDVLASLPFSKLKVEEGEIRFTPRTGVMNPKLRVTGTSRISGYDVNILVHGNVDNPQTSLTSSPPLPESEIMALLGTGATTSSLQNRDAVALKALQLLLIKLRDNKKIPGGNKLFGGVLKGIEKLNLQVGEEDPFTGRKFTSASLDLSDSLFFTTQIDENQQARGLLIYQIRFK